MSKEIRNRYINADLFKENINPVWYLDSEYCGVYDKKDIEDMIDAQPTADVQEVRHGHWIELINPNYSPSDGMHEYIYICSKCGRKEYKRETYCHCGAKMDEEINDDEIY